MPRTAATFVQSDLSRALRACRDAGVADKVMVRLEKGTIVILPLGTAQEPSRNRSQADDGSLEELPEI